MLARDHQSGEKQQKQQLDREMRDMMSTLTRRLVHFHKKPTEGGGASSNIHDVHDEEDDHGGFGIVTMAGSNEGATMREELDLMSMKGRQSLAPPLTTYLNSNFQGVNNSIMAGGSYSANDPGIHMEVDDHYKQRQAGRHGKTGKKKANSGSSKSDHSSSS